MKTQFTHFTYSGNKPCFQEIVQVNFWLLHHHQINFQLEVLVDFFILENRLGGAIYLQFFVYNFPVLLEQVNMNLGIK